MDIVSKAWCRESRIAELEALNEQNRTDLAKVTRLLAKERAKVERLREALEEILNNELALNDRLRGALETIMSLHTYDIDSNQSIAKKALKKE